MNDERSKIYLYSSTAGREGGSVSVVGVLPDDISIDLSQEWENLLGSGMSGTAKVVVEKLVKFAKKSFNKLGVFEDLIKGEGNMNKISGWYVYKGGSYLELPLSFTMVAEKEGGDMDLKRRVKDIYLMSLGRTTGSDKLYDNPVQDVYVQLGKILKLEDCIVKDVKVGFGNHLLVDGSPNKVDVSITLLTQKAFLTGDIENNLFYK